MTDVSIVLLFAFTGISAITIIDTLGAILSRKLKFNYGWLSILSFLVYTFTAYFISSKADLFTVLAINYFIGLYDATVGWKLCIALHANTGKTDKELSGISLNYRLLLMLFISLGFGYLGYWMSTDFLN
jgi:hypothetical protein